jgi:tetratricopeptide (TPR) repeat protein
MNGEHHLNAPLNFLKGDLVGGAPPTGEIAARAALLTDFTQALVYLAYGDTASAGRTIESAVDRVKDSDPFPGREVVYLFASHIALVQANEVEPAEAKAPRNAAASYAEAALAANPSYGRGYIARGNVYFDKGEYYLAMVDYQRALELPDQPHYHWIAEKAHFSLGNIFLTQLLEARRRETADSNELDALAVESLNHYRYVISAYENESEPDLRLRTMAAEAHAFIGRVHHARGEYDQATVEYEAGLVLTPRPTVVAETLNLLETLKELQE